MLVYTLLLRVLAEEKCRRIIGRTASEGYDINGTIVCDPLPTCTEIHDALREVSNYTIPQWKVRGYMQ